MLPDTQNTWEQQLWLSRCLNPSNWCKHIFKSHHNCLQRNPLHNLIRQCEAPFNGWFDRVQYFLMRTRPSNMGLFTVKQLIHRSLSRFLANGDPNSSLRQHLQKHFLLVNGAIGSIAGLAIQTTIYPFDYFRVILSNEIKLSYKFHQFSQNFIMIIIVPWAASAAPPQNRPQGHLSLFQPTSLPLRNLEIAQTILKPQKISKNIPPIVQMQVHYQSYWKLMKFQCHYQCTERR